MVRDVRNTVKILGKPTLELTENEKKGLFGRRSLVAVKEIRKGEIFIRENVRRMRIISWCCACAAGVCALSALYYLPFAFVAAAAGFMALIVRIVKNAFEQAIAMKDELDLTI